MTKAWGYVDCPYCNEQVELRLKLKKEVETKTVQCDNDGCRKDFVIRYHAVKTVDVMAAPMPDHMQPLTDEQRKHEGLFCEGKEPAITRESIRSAVEAMDRQDRRPSGLYQDGRLTIHDSTPAMTAERMAELVSRVTPEGVTVVSTRKSEFFEPSDWVRKYLRGPEDDRVPRMEAENASLALKNVSLDAMTRALRRVAEGKISRGAAVQIEPRAEFSMRVLKLRDTPEPQVEVRMDDRFKPPVEAAPDLIDRAVQAAPDTWGRITRAWSPASLIDDKED